MTVSRKQTLFMLFIVIFVCHITIQADLLVNEAPYWNIICGVARVKVNVSSVHLIFKCTHTYFQVFENRNNSKILEMSNIMYMYDDV